MPVIPVYLNIDEQTYAGIKAGVLELCGMAKNIENKRIAKHIPVVADAAKKGASTAIDFIQNHKKGAFILSGVLIIGGTIAGTIGYVSSQKQRELEKQFGEALQNYLESARNGTLTVEELNLLIEAIERIENRNLSKKIDLHISASQLSDLIYCIFDYTVRLAQINSFNVKSINRPKYFKEKTADDLKYYLNIQREILQQTA